MQPIRINSVQCTKDGRRWKVKASWHNDDVYTDPYDQNPYYYNPVLNPGGRVPYPWKPHASSYIEPNDALFPGNFTFRTLVGVQQMASGDTQPVLQFSGHIPINVLSQKTQAPWVPYQAQIEPGAGLPIGTCVVGVAAIDEDGRSSAVSQLVKAVVPSAGGGALIVPNMVWPSSAAGYRVFSGRDSMSMNGSWVINHTTPSTISTSILPDNDGAPDPFFAKFRVLVTPIVHGGIWGLAVNATGSNSFTFTGASVTAGQFNGRILSKYGTKAGSSIADPLGTGFVYQWQGNSLVTNDDGNGTFTVAQSPLTAVGDVFVMRAQANIASENTIGDALFVNPLAPDGLTAGAEVGNIVLIIAGTGEGQSGAIIANDSTTLTVGQNWTIIPDSTSVFIILSANPVYDFDTSPISFDGVNGSVNQIVAQVAVPNLAGSSNFVQIITKDSSGNQSPAKYAPFSEIYIFGTPPAVTSPGYFLLTPDADGNVQIDLAWGAKFRVVLTGTPPQIKFLKPIYTGGKIVAGMQIWLYVDQDSAGRHLGPLFDTDSTTPGAWSMDVAAWQIDDDPLMRASYAVTYHDDAVWGLDSDPRNWALPGSS